MSNTFGEYRSILDEQDFILNEAVKYRLLSAIADLILVFDKTQFTSRESPIYFHPFLSEVMGPDKFFANTSRGIIDNYLNWFFRLEEWKRQLHNDDEVGWKCDHKFDDQGEFESVACSHVDENELDKRERAVAVQEANVIFCFGGDEIADSKISRLGAFKAAILEVFSQCPDSILARLQIMKLVDEFFESQGIGMETFAEEEVLSGVAHYIKYLILQNGDDEARKKIEYYRQGAVENIAQIPDVLRFHFLRLFADFDEDVVAVMAGVLSNAQGLLEGRMRYAREKLPDGIVKERLELIYVQCIQCLEAVAPKLQRYLAS